MPDTGPAARGQVLRELDVRRGGSIVAIDSADSGRHGRIQSNAMPSVAGICIAAVLAVACEGALSRSSEAPESGVEGVATGGARPIESLARAPAGWSAPPAADSLYVLRVDRSEYLARPPIPRRDRGTYTFTLVATFRNSGTGPVNLEHCQGYRTYGIELVGPLPLRERPRAAYSPAWNCAGSDNKLSVEPGETRVDTIRLWGPTSWDGRTRQPRGVLDGTFRLAYTLDGCPVGVACRTPYIRSQPFDVITAREAKLPAAWLPYPPVRTWPWYATPRSMTRLSRRRPPPGS